MKLDFFSFLLPFQASIAPSTQFEHGHARKLATPADLQADVAGLIAMSRTLWLETIHATKDTSEEAGKVIPDFVKATLIVYNHTASQTKPVRDNQSSRSLFAGIDNWEHQTAAFLDEHIC
ncbi:uncharacterized protein F4807DRAFT_431564 [Annulohypoxylon truncatum]|uniref:uncharacterized protein n=1 Tax=Annulohypoxylon truncatum TaxID=327061 RepID=UPI00200725E4|nr:uncharacterized protein F4807DRAFT_431564 [Annulohypoxylon truncatum]KAI1208507.1 hypothetical protein F4807DRAFT_431564 [Annulohypoxylon truncatum]